MYKQYVKSKKGASLILVMFAMVILSLLGIALMSLAIINYKTNMADRNSKKAFYLSESGLDQAYQKLCTEVKLAIDYAEGEIEKKDIEGLIILAREQERGDPENDISPKNSLLIQNHPDGSINPMGEVDQQELYDLLNKWFKEYYYEHITKRESDSLELLLIKKLDNIHYSAAYTAFADGTRGIPKVEVESTSTTAAGVELTLSSEYIHEGITKKTRITYNVIIPDYKQQYAFDSEVKYNLPKNALYAKALTAEKDIFVNSGNVTINGDIYAGGNTANPISETGIVMGSSGQLNINGKTITGGYIRTNANNAAININGDVYCNTVFIPENTSGSKIVVGSTATSKKYNVHTLEDLRMDGLSANISIYGNYYGFSKGDTAYMNRSSIIVNSDDFSNGSSIKISGQQPVANTKFSDGSDKPMGSVIAGSSFVRLEADDGTPVLYQTGEGVSVKGNYAAYTMGLEQDSITADEDKNKYDTAHIYFESLNPLYIATGFDLNSDGILDSYFGSSAGAPLDNYNIEGVTYRIYKGLAEKNKYFGYAYNQDSELIKFGDQISMDIQNVQYSTGIYIDRNVGAAPLQKYLNPAVAEPLTKFPHEYDYYVNMQEDPQITNYLNAAYFNKKVKIEDLFNFNANITVKEKYPSGLYTNELYYTYPNSDKNLVLIGPSDGSSVYTPSGGWVTNNNDIYTSNTGTFKGIIITKGDVYLTGMIDFTGTIVTTGNIYIMDNNTKKITNDYDELIFTDKNNCVIKKVTNDLNQPETQLGDLFKTTESGSQKIFITLSTVDTITDESYINFKEIIQTKAWQRIK